MTKHTEKRIDAKDIATKAKLISRLIHRHHNDIPYQDRPDVVQDIMFHIATKYESVNTTLIMLEVRTFAKYYRQNNFGKGACGGRNLEVLGGAEDPIGGCLLDVKHTLDTVLSSLDKRSDKAIIQACLDGTEDKYTAARLRITKDTLKKRRQRLMRRIREQVGELLEYKERAAKQ